jgi:hypothetical protein
VKPAKSKRKSRTVKDSENILSLLKNKCSENEMVLKEAKKRHRTIIRKIKATEDIVHNEKLFSFFSSNPATAFKTIKSAKSSSPIQVPYITVGDKKYHGDRVIDGLFESISRLKTAEPHVLATSPYHGSLMDDYRNIKY